MLLSRVSRINKVWRTDFGFGLYWKTSTLVPNNFKFPPSRIICECNNRKPIIEEWPLTRKLHKMFHNGLRALLFPCNYFVWRDPYNPVLIVLNTSDILRFFIYFLRWLIHSFHKKKVQTEILLISSFSSRTQFTQAISFKMANLVYFNYCTLITNQVYKENY